MEQKHDIEAIVTFLPTDAGGRKSPAFSDYRAQFYYEGHDWDARQYYPDVSQVNPGDTARSLIAFLSPDEHWGKIDVGTMFLIREGQRTIGYGKVTAILSLEESAKRMKQVNG